MKVQQLHVSVMCSAHALRTDNYPIYLCFIIFITSNSELFPVFMVQGQYLKLSDCFCDVYQRSKAK